MSLIPYSSGLKIYERMPPKMRRTVGSLMRPVPRRMLLGNGFQEQLKDLRASEYWTREELERYQVKRLRALLAHAERSVPYYHDLFRAAKLDSATADLRSLKELPVLTKDIIRSEHDRLRAVNSPEFHPGEANTTGSTGRPLRFLVDQQTREVEHAAVWRHYLGSGISGLDGRIASFRGDFVSERSGGPLWRWDGRVKELTFNTYVLDQDNVRKMVDELDRFHPEAMRGYPHSLFILSTKMEASGLRLGFVPRFVHTSSEQLPRHMRETIERVLGCPVRDWYSQSEYVISAGECSEGTYHQTMETGIVRIQEDAWGMERLIGTGLWNMSMPFINYEIGDHVAIGEEDCPCGRKHLVLGSIEGRVNDVIVTADGNALSGVGIDNFYEKEVIPALAGAPEYMKLVQDGIASYTVEAFRSAGLAESDEQSIKKAFRALLGQEADITVKTLDKMPDQKKWKNVESRLSPEDIARLLRERSG
ncbi:MAG: phenylacetate--CoA ligase family protein [Methanomassiliicoccus sp.]|nr:phenylacetate--CoA ligase family protein [Methanomassiliicoccus sp.]